MPATWNLSSARYSAVQYELRGWSGDPCADSEIIKANLINYVFCSDFDHIERAKFNRAKYNIDR